MVETIEQHLAPDIVEDDLVLETVQWVASIALEESAAEVMADTQIPSRLVWLLQGAGNVLSAVVVS